MSLFKNEVGRPSNEIKKKRRVLAFSIIGLVTLTVAFAALSRTLRINGSAQFSGKWDIHFDEYEEGSGIIKEKKGYAKYSDTAEIVTPDKVTINNMDVEFMAPGDAVIYKFSIVNEGSIKGKISNLIVTPGDITAQDSSILELVKSHFKYEFKYDDKVGEDVVQEGDIIDAGERKKVGLEYYLDGFDYEGTFDLSSKVKISDLSVTIEFEQADNSSVTPAGDTNELKAGDTIPSGYILGNIVTTWNSEKMDMSGDVYATTQEEFEFYKSGYESEDSYGEVNLTYKGSTLPDDLSKNAELYNLNDMVLYSFWDYSLYSYEGINIMVTANVPSNIYTKILGYDLVGMENCFLYNESVVDLSDFVIPSTVKSLKYAFKDASNLEVAPNIPTNVSNLEYAFINCPKLTEVTYEGTLDQFKKIEGYDDAGDNGLVIHCTNGDYVIGE